MRICWRLAISRSPHTSTLAGRDFMVTRLASSPTRDAPSEGVRTGCRVERLKAWLQLLWSFAARPLVRKIAVPLAVVSLLAIHAGLLAYSATTHSPTVNEPGHLVAGLSYWEFGRFEVYRVNPPLTRLIAALPVMAAGYEVDWGAFYEGPGARPEFALGADFIKANGERSIWLFTIARWACIPISLIGAMFCFTWAKELYGKIAGLVALTLWCFSPNILAHAELVTPDAAATAFGIGAGYVFWRWLKMPTWEHAACAGLLLGLAELSKMSWLLLFGLWPLLWIFWRLTSGNERWSWPAWRKQGIQLTAILLGGLYLLNLGYLFDRSFTQLKNFTFVSETLAGPEDAGGGGNRLAETWLGELPMPVPKQYLQGLDLQKRDFENYGQPSYLRGKWKDSGWWYYYLYGCLVKVPHGTQLLFLFAVGLSIVAIRAGNWRNEIILLAPAISLFILLSSQTEFSHHFRYLMPCLGILMVFLGKPIQRTDGRWLSGLFIFIQSPRASFMTLRTLDLFVRRSLAGLTLLCVASSAMSCLRTYPHSLAYFNEAAGGPENGHRHMLHSSFDWGQDLLFVGSYFRLSPIGSSSEPIYVASPGPCRPSALIGSRFWTAPYGPWYPGTFEPLPDIPLPTGIYVVSKAFVAGSSDGLTHERAYDSFESREPIAEIAATLWVFRLPAGSEYSSNGGVVAGHVGQWRLSCQTGRM